MTNLFSFIKRFAATTAVLAFGLVGCQKTYIEKDVFIISGSGAFEVEEVSNGQEGVGFRLVPVTGNTGKSSGLTDNLQFTRFVKPSKTARGPVTGATSNFPLNFEDADRELNFSSETITQTYNFTVNYANLNDYSLELENDAYTYSGGTEGDSTDKIDHLPFDLREDVEVDIVGAGTYDLLATTDHSILTIYDENGILSGNPSVRGQEITEDKDWQYGATASETINVDYTYLLSGSEAQIDLPYDITVSGTVSDTAYTANVSGTAVFTISDVATYTHYHLNFDYEVEEVVVVNSEVKVRIKFENDFGVEVIDVTVPVRVVVEVTEEPNSAPEANITSADVTLAASTSYTVLFNVSDVDDDIVLVELFQDGTRAWVVWDATIDVTTPISTSTTIGGGTNVTRTYFIRVTDSAGNVTDSNSVTVEWEDVVSAYDMSAPADPGIATLYGPSNRTFNAGDTIAQPDVNTTGTVWNDAYNPKLAVGDYVTITAIEGTASTDVVLEVIRGSHAGGTGKSLVVRQGTLTFNNVSHPEFTISEIVGL